MNVAGLALGQNSIRPGRMAPFHHIFRRFPRRPRSLSTKFAKETTHMATMSSARFRSLYRRRKQAYEAVYHFAANSVGHSIAGFSATRTTEVL